MIEKQIVNCPWCNENIEIDIPPADAIACPKCGKKCEPWADGDIDFNAWYLTTI